MIVPIAIIAMDDKLNPIKDRSKNYLIDSFSQYFHHVIGNKKMWSRWVMIFMNKKRK